MPYIVELEKGCWLAPWNGDPGRTVVKKNAKVFHTAQAAAKGLAKAMGYSDFLQARFEVVGKPQELPQDDRQLGLMLEEEAKENGFDGDTYQHGIDGKRLTGQLLRVWEVVRDGRWYTLAQLAILADGSESGVSARLRDLRKERFGGFVVERTSLGAGLHQYRVKRNQSTGDRV